MFYCKECGIEYKKWLGKCDCGAWNSLIEVKEEKKTKNNFKTVIANYEDDQENIETIKLDFNEFTRVCSLNKKGVIVLGGEPGIGKSTLMSQIACKINGKCLYFTGEESTASVRKRINRVKEKSDNSLNIVQVKYLVFMEQMEEIIKEFVPDLVVLDSIHTTRYENSDTNIKEIIFHFSNLAKKYNFCAFTISHITKDGIIAGPKTLEHMVDVVLYLEGDRYGSIRLLRSIKNRFGANETGVFNMDENGLNELANPSALFLSQRRKNVHGEDCEGSVVFAGISGSRPCLIEIQALVTDAYQPSLEVVGYEYKRVRMILSILKKWCNINLNLHDIFVNIVGGISIDDPSADLPIAIAILSSAKRKPISAEICFFGELGLTGEIRTASNEILRIKEAVRLGFKRIFTNRDDSKNKNQYAEVKIIKDIISLVKALN